MHGDVGFRRNRDTNCEPAPTVFAAFHTAYGRVGVVHAEAPHPDWDRATALLETGHLFHEDNSLLGFEADDPASQAAQETPVAGLRALVSGHFVVAKVTVTANRWNLDTGAGFADRNRLCLLEINAPEFEAMTFEVAEGT